ncbi:hypothetical protein SLG_32940 [Sphingobium sp. SYK-6]|nr:hypothetical protein SLG_32940 [Sphingobium sp. SYK-6]
MASREIGPAPTPESQPSIVPVCRDATASGHSVVKGALGMSRRETEGPAIGRLASRPGTWQGACMSGPSSPDPRQRMGGGAPIALLSLLGTILGGFLGQPVIGLLAGFGIGVLIAILVWRMGPR